MDSAVAKDALELLGHDSTLSSMVLAVPLSEPSTLSAAERRLGERIAAHVGSAFRLRRQRAVCSTTQRLFCRPRSARALVYSVTWIDAQRCLRPTWTCEARSYRRRRRPGGVARLRGTVVTRRLRRFRREGVRARRRERAEGRRCQRAHQSTTCGALAGTLGYGNKQIAYALGISQAAVSMSLRRARQAAGLGTRAERFGRSIHN